ncbi:MAG TPA: ATP-binding cassette domain-containing protein [Mycobacteriales bacterium]|jgi:putative ABC transport system ATP-binding protein|nr:ATP-binding cassette domain-containing protein [Mycobacteriales bacterium]
MSAVSIAGSGPLLVADDVAVGYRRTPLLESVSWTVAPGSETALTGRSGSGKSTLLLVLAGLLPPLTGVVRWPGLGVDASTRSGQIGLVFQAPSLLPELTATENVALPLRLRGSDRLDAEAAASAALAAVGLDGAAQALPGQLSGGQQQRVAIARVIAGSPRLVLADEPTGALDRGNAAAVLTVLRDAVRASGGALIVATHDEELAALLGDRAEVRDGQLLINSDQGARR